MSLYDDIGGEAGVRAVLRTLYDRLFDDLMVGFLFAGKDKEKLIEQQLWFTAKFLGGPSRYEGKSIPDAFLAMYMFETTCNIQLAAQAGGPLTMVHPDIVAGVGESMRTQTGNQGGAFVWPALLRKLDRMDASYRT